MLGKRLALAAAALSLLVVSGCASDHPWFSRFNRCTDQPAGCCTGGGETVISDGPVLGNGGTMTAPPPSCGAAPAPAPAPTPGLYNPQPAQPPRLVPQPQSRVYMQ